MKHLPQYRDREQNRPAQNATYRKLIPKIWILLAVSVKCRAVNLISIYGTYVHCVNTPVMSGKSAPLSHDTNDP